MIFRPMLFQNQCCGMLYYKLPYDHLCNPDLLADQNNPGNATCQVGWGWMINGLCWPIILTKQMLTNNHKKYGGLITQVYGFFCTQDALLLT